MGDDGDVDKIERDIPQKNADILGAPSGTGRSGVHPMANENPGQEDAESTRDQLKERMKAKADALRYMGQGHPQRAQFEHELNTMQKMLDQIEGALHSYE